MPTDVIIDPSSGQIYWNDGTGSPQSISLGGNAQDTISVTGYGAVFTPGSTVGGTTVLVRFKDSALETLAPGTSGYELGSSTLRWKLFATTGNFSDSTNSTSLTSGAFQIQGGIAVSGNASFGQSILFWTPGGANYIGFRAPASAGNTTYVLPSAAPISGATGTSVLSSDQSGILSWVQMTSGSAGGGSSTISVVTAGNNSVFHPILFTPTSGSSSGAAVSSNTTLFYLPSTEVFYASGIWVTSTTVSSNQGTGAILIAGGMGVSGQINAASMQIAGNAIINGNLQFNGNGTFGNATSDTINSLARYISDILPSTDNSYDLGNNALGWRNTYFSGIGTFAGALRVTSSTTATSTASGALSVTGGVGIQGNAFIGGTTNFAGINLISNSTSSTSTGTGSLVNIGGFGNAGNVFIGGTINAAGITLISNSTSSTSTATGSLVNVGGFGLAGNAFIGGTVNAAGIVLISNNTNTTSTTTGSLINVGGFGLQGNAYIGGTVNITSTNQGAYGSTTAGALVVAGTVGVGLSMYIGGQLGVGGTLDYLATGNVAYFAGNNNSYTQVIVHNHNSGNSASSDFIVSNDSATDTTFFGDFGMNSSGWAATTSAYNTANAVYLVSNSGDLALGSLTTNAIRFFYNNSANDALALGAIGMTVYYGTTASSTGTGALQVRGGVGITGNAFIGGTINIGGQALFLGQVVSTTNTSAISTSTGALVVTGGVGIGQSLYVGGMVRVGSNTFTKANNLGDVSLDNGSPTDTPGVTYYWGNNSNFGTDVLSEGVGSTRYRVVYNLNETGGREVFTVDTNANLRLYNVAGTSFFGMRYSGSASTTYTMPANSPQSAAGTSVLSSTTDGTMSWVPLAASSNPTASFATTAGNVQTQLIGNPNTQHAVLLTPTISSAGSALSGNGTLVYNPFSDILSTPGLAVTSSTTSISATTGSLIVTGGVGIGGSLYVTTSVPSNISGFYVFNGVLSGSALTATASLTATNIRTTANTLNIVDSSIPATVLQYNGTRFAILITNNSTTSSDGALVVTGGAGFGATINVNGNIGARSGYELRAFNTGDTAYTGFRFTGSASTTYILPVAAPAIGNSVLQSSVGGVMSWVPMATGSGSPAGNNTELQFNNGGTFGGATGITYQSTSYLVSIASTADQRAVTTVGLRLVNNAAVAIAGVQQRFSPAFEIAGRTVTTPNIENFNRFLTEVVGTINSYGAQQQWKYSLDTGTPTYTNPIFVIHSQKGVGIGFSAITFQNFFRASATQAIELTYVLPVAYPGTGTSVLSSNTTGDLSWVPMTSGGSGTPGGSNRQIQYNNSSTFGGASGFEYVSAGNAVTVNIFATAGGGSTSGLSINTINGTTTRIGIGLTNPAFELEIRGELSATNKSFVIDHPTKPGMKLRYGSLEGPENGVYVRGQLLGTNIIETPDYWRGLVHDDSCTIHLTPIGNYLQLYVEKIQDYKVYVGTASTFEINCFYSVWAERKDISKLTVEY